jgi:hypothetical protein
MYSLIIYKGMATNVSSCRDFEMDNIVDFKGQIDIGTPIGTEALTTTDKPGECKAKCINDTTCGMWAVRGNNCNKYKVDAAFTNRFNGLLVHPVKMYNSGFPNAPYDVSVQTDKDACRTKCKQDPDCNLFEFDSSDQTCTLSKCSSPGPTGYVRSTRCLGFDCLKGKEFYAIVNQNYIVYKFHPTATTLSYFNGNAPPGVNRCLENVSYNVSTGDKTRLGYTNPLIPSMYPGFSTSVFLQLGLDNTTFNETGVYNGETQLTVQEYFQENRSGMSLIGSCSPTCVLAECVKGKEYYYLDNNIRVVYRFHQTDLKLSYFNSLGRNVPSGTLCADYTYTVSADKSQIEFTYSQSFTNYKIILKNFQSTTFDEYDQRFQYFYPTDPNRWDFTRFLFNPDYPGLTMRPSCSPTSVAETPVPPPTTPVIQCPDIFECVKGKEYVLETSPLPAYPGRIIIKFFIDDKTQLLLSLGGQNCILVPFDILFNRIRFTRILINPNTLGRTTLSFTLSNAVPDTSVDLNLVRGTINPTFIGNYTLLINTGDAFPIGACTSITACPSTNQIPYCEDGSDPNKLLCADGTKPKCFDMCSDPDSVCPSPITTLLKFMNDDDYSDRIEVSNTHINILGVKYRYFVLKTDFANVFQFITYVDTFLYKKDTIGNPSVTYHRLISLRTNYSYTELSMYFYKRTIIAPVSNSYKSISPITSSCGEPPIDKEEILYHCYMFDHPQRCKYSTMLKSKVNTVHGIDEVSPDLTINEEDIVSYEHLLCPYEDISATSDFIESSWFVDTESEKMNIFFNPINKNVIEELETFEINVYHDYFSFTSPIGNLGIRYEIYDQIYGNGEYCFVLTNSDRHNLPPLLKGQGQSDIVIKMVSFTTSGSSNPPTVNVNTLYFRSRFIQYFSEGSRSNIIKLDVCDKYGNVGNKPTTSSSTQKQNVDAFFNNIRYLRISYCKLRNIEDENLKVINVSINNNGTIGSYYMYESQLPSGIDGYNRCPVSISSSTSTSTITCSDIFEAIEKCNLEPLTIGFEWNESSKQVKFIYVSDQTSATTDWNNHVISHIENGSWRFHSECVDYRYRGRIDPGDNVDTLYNHHSYLVHNRFPKQCVTPISDAPLLFKEIPLKNKMFDIKTSNPMIPYNQNDYNVQGQQPTWTDLNYTKYVYMRSNQPHIGYKFFRGIPLFYRMNHYYKSEYGELKMSPLTINVSSVEIDNATFININLLMYRTSPKFNLIGKKFENGSFFIYFHNSTILEDNTLTKYEYKINGNNITTTFNGSIGPSFVFDPNTNTIIKQSYFGSDVMTLTLSTTVTSTELFFITTEDGGIIDYKKTKTGIFSNECLWYIVQYEKRKIFLVSFEDENVVLELNLSNDFSVLDIPEVERYNPLEFWMYDNKKCGLKMYDSEVWTDYDYRIAGNVILVYSGTCDNDFKIVRKFAFSWEGEIFDLTSGYKMIPYMYPFSTPLNNQSPTPSRIYTGTCKPTTSEYGTDICKFARDVEPSGSSPYTMFRGSFVRFYQNQEDQRHNRANKLAETIGINMLKVLVTILSFGRGRVRGKEVVTKIPPRELPTGKPTKSIETVPIKEPAGKGPNIPIKKPPFEKPPAAKNPADDAIARAESNISKTKLPSGREDPPGGGGGLKSPNEGNTLTAREASGSNGSIVQKVRLEQPPPAPTSKPPSSTGGGTNQNAKKDLKKERETQGDVPISHMDNGTAAVGNLGTAFVDRRNTGSGSATGIVTQGETAGMSTAERINYLKFASNASKPATGS